MKNGKLVYIVQFRYRNKCPCVGTTATATGALWITWPPMISSNSAWINLWLNSKRLLNFKYFKNRTRRGDRLVKRIFDIERYTDKILKLTLTRHRHATDTPPTRHRHATDTPPSRHRHATDTPPTRHRHATDTPPSLTPTRHRHATVTDTDTPPSRHRHLHCYVRCIYSLSTNPTYPLLELLLE
jgi:hypothetical protein